MKKFSLVESVHRALLSIDLRIYSKPNREENQREWDREWNERLCGAHLPAIPNMSLTMLEKCR